MSIERKTLATELNFSSMISSEDISILFATNDNKSFCINIASCKNDRTDGIFPNEIILSEKPLNNFKIISRIITDKNYSRDMFNSRCKVIANSIEDKLKSFAIINELRNCL
jgi:hypothetical protein